MLTRGEPLSEQVKREITDRIASGEFVDANGRLPSEDKLSSFFGVSRSTIRSALSSLEDSSVLTRRHGAGTFVNDLGIPPNQVWGWIDEALTFEDMIRTSQHEARTEVHDWGVREAGPHALSLHLDADSLIFWTSKVFISDEAPIIYSETGIPLAIMHAGAISEEELGRASAMPVYEILRRRCGCTVHHQICDVRALAADEAVARRLNYAPDFPLLVLEEIGFGTDQTPLYHAIHRFRADSVSFRLVRKPALNIVQGERP